MQKFSPSISRDGAKTAFLVFGGAQASKIEVRVRNLRTGQEMSIPLQEVDVHLVPRLSPDGSLRIPVIPATESERKRLSVEA